MIAVVSMEARWHEAAAELLVAELAIGWPSLAEARTEAVEMCAPDRICIAAVEGDALVGWIGGLELYDGHVWELHPLVVARDHQGRGIGRQLVAALEDAVVERGAHTLWLGTDDMRDPPQTSLGGIELYPDPLAHLTVLQNLNRHPYEFYARCGFRIVGIVPDANGWGKPDILMAKRI